MARRLQTAEERLQNRTVGAVLAEIRRELRLSLSQASQKTGLQLRATTIGSWERGERAVMLPNLFILADAYGVEVGELLARIERRVKGVAEPVVRGAGHGRRSDDRRRPDLRVVPT